ncbi:hypothetical protein JRO89_XS01G0306800 [Xanthoceras sorbifolium]|uniref:rRNA adenine N(6)-methyltransferase n=1 Tax=Xanthoceras sorbifolium TaxID=99658 RepID=A0ABQ8IME9_9ROSI|nr:hypothetical protein JRO89_XS01G0306800 [Xanthoceras sorbifolium]
MTTILLQNPPLTSPESRPKPTLPVHSITTGARKRAIYIACARKQDDYNATLKALNSRGRFPRKSLGQHYMLNSEINEQLVDAADVKEGDVVLEIGPGTGSLTNVLLNAGATVLAIEKDPHMVALLRERFSSTDRFKVLQEDFVKCHIRTHMLSLFQSRESLKSRAGYAKVVANIPFNISTDVVKQLLPMGEIFSEVVLLLQVKYNVKSLEIDLNTVEALLSDHHEETAVRLVEPTLRTSEYRPINILVNFYSGYVLFYTVRSLFILDDTKCRITSPFQFDCTDLPIVCCYYGGIILHAHNQGFSSIVAVSNCLKIFDDVDAAVVTFKLKQATDYPSVNSAFNGKRKMLRKSLQHLCTSLEIEKALGDVGLPATSRPEELTVDDFVKLHNLITEV